jgi:hypothetical protein
VLYRFNGIDWQRSRLARAARVGAIASVITKR